MAAGINPRTGKPYRYRHGWIPLTATAGAEAFAASGGRGFSVNRKGERPTEGFMVSEPGAEQVFDTSAFTRNVAGLIAGHGIQHRSRLAEGDEVFHGGWVEGDKTYLDISRNVGDSDEAMARAISHDQLALYDVKADVEVRTLIGDWQAEIDSRAGDDLTGLPSKPFNVPGRGEFVFHSNADIQRIADDYVAEHRERLGLSDHPRDYTPVNPETAAKIAQAYADMEHNPDDPEVAAAYKALKDETLAQYEALVEAGYEFAFFPTFDPYSNSPREAIFDLTVNRKMFVYPTDDGFGSGDDFPGNPLLEIVSGLEWGGKPVTYNDVFRAVHDTFGHAKEGLGFRWIGEDNAYRQHSAMFSPQARRALASETRGQNSWVNFGPNGDSNRTGSVLGTIYADQKTGLLPDWAIDPDLHRPGKAKRSMDYSILTPVTVDLASVSDVATNRRTGQVAFWKQILPMKAINYTAKDGSRQSIDFDADYLTDLAKMEGIDKIGFLLADKSNAHTMDPERWRGDVVKMEVRDTGDHPGLYGKIVFPSREAATAVLNNPDLGVSARIREGIERSDGTTVDRGIIHVLGTLDPQVSGMTPWETADLSTEAGEILDLTDERYEDMGTETATDLAKDLSEFTEEDIDAMSQDELDAFLAKFSPDFDATLVTDEVVEDEPKADEPAADEIEPATEDNKHEAAKELVGAGADMSKVEADIELANGRAQFAESQAREALSRLAAAEWKGERESLLGAGVPPHMLDLATPVLERANDMVIDLSNSEEDDLNVSEIVRGLLHAAKGTVDLSAEEGHSGTFKAGDGEDPDAELLNQWDAQS